MTKIPELLVSLSGEAIQNKEQWEQFRRKEILQLFSEYVYGVREIERPENLFFKVVEKTECMGMRKKEIRIGFGEFAFPVTMYLPFTEKKALPAYIYIMHEYQEDEFIFDEEGNLGGCGSVIPLKNLTDRGYAVAIMPTRSIYRDWEEHAEYKQGIFAAVSRNKPRGKNSWASISAWAWGASRVLDYLETDGDIDSRHVAVLGHSRGGKAALWAGATDERFYYVLSNNSGCAGAAILRGNTGEHIKDINISDWFCENFRDYDDCEEFLPVDQHMLLALIAPRYLYVSSSSEDKWAGPEWEYQACQMANEAYELYKQEGLVYTAKKPELEKPCQEGHIGYHMKQGKHSITAYDWEQFTNFFDKIRG